MTKESFREQFFALADAASQIVVTSHMSPDDDSIGSVLAMHAVLAARYPEKVVRILYSGPVVDRYQTFTNFNKIEWVGDIADNLNGIDLLVMLDASKYERFSMQPEKLQQVPVRACIDHHASDAHEFSLLLKEETFSSTCELLYRTFLDGHPLTKELAEYLLLGLVGDTGGFAYVRPGQTAAFTLGAMLVEAVGMPIDQFRSRYMGIPVRIIPLLQALVANTMYETVPGWPPVQHAHVPRAVLSQGAYTDEDMSAASHIYMSQYLPRVQGYPWGFVATPRADGACRMSARSLPGSVNVRDLFERLNAGGGHDRAAGAFFAVPEPKDCIKAVVDFMRANEPLLR